MTTPDTVRRSRNFDASPEEVWEAFTDPDQLEQWWGGEVDLEVAPDAEGTVEIEGESAVVYVEEVEPQRRLVYRWATVSEPPSRVEIDVEAIPGGTRLTVVEQPLPNEGLPVAQACARRSTSACVSAHALVGVS